MIRILFKTVLVLLGAILLCLATDFAYRDYFQLKYPWPQNIFPKPPIAEKYQIVKIGNSHAEDGITFEKYKMRSLSLASVAQSFEFDLANLKMYSNQIEEGAIIIINVSPISFSQGKPNKVSSLQYVYYDGRLSPFVIPRLQIGSYLESQIFPFVRDVYLWRQAYAKEAQEIAANTFVANWPKPTPKPIEPVIYQTSEISTTSGEIQPKTGQPSLTAEQELALAPFQSDNRLEESVNFMFKKWHDPNDFGQKYFDSNRADLEKIIKYCLDRKWRPVLISIPISQKLIDALGKEYMRKYVDEPLKKTNTRNILQIDFSDLAALRKNAFLFGNSDHLSPQGALIFSHFLMDRLAKSGYVRAEQNGYLIE